MSRIRTGLRHDTRAFDTWLERKLHQMFDAVADEPLPHQLQSLVDRIACRNEEHAKAMTTER
jgi:hypothetical protein